MTEPHAVPLLAAGTYRGGGGRGLQVLCRTGAGDWRVGDVHTDACNASFSVYSARHDLHYIVDENTRGEVGVHRHARDGWTLLATVSSGGAAPCHVALDPAETLLAVANYGSGSTALIRLDDRTGLPDGAAQVQVNVGSGPDRQRQEGPHAHWVGFSPDGRWLYQTDLGTDEIRAFAVDEDGTLGMARTAYVAPPGSGPRHLLLHPRLHDRAYLACELANTLTLLDRAADGMFENPRILSTLPPQWAGDSIVAHLAMNAAATRLYVSNRGHDSIAVFAIDDAGVPTLLDHVTTGGESPRFFLVLEDQREMIVAHEKSQTVTTLAIGPDGRLSPTGVVLPIPGVAYVLRVDPVAKP